MNALLLLAQAVTPEDPGRPWLLWLALAIAYFVPAITAVGRQHPSKAAIILLNLLLGWTGIVWLAALIWAFSGQDRSRLKKCPACAEMVQKDAKVCRYCQKQLA